MLLIIRWRRTGRWISIDPSGLISNLEIVGIIGEGKKKITYEVKLPWGDQAVLKRCDV